MLYNSTHNGSTTVEDYRRMMYMLKYFNKDGKKVMEVTDDGETKILNEKLKETFDNEPDEDPGNDSVDPQKKAEVEDE